MRSETERHQKSWTSLVQRLFLLCFHFCYSNLSLIWFLDILQLLHLVEQRFQWTIEAGQNLEAESNSILHWRCWTEVDIDRTMFFCSPGVCDERPTHWELRMKACVS